MTQPISNVTSLQRPSFPAVDPTLSQARMTDQTGFQNLLLQSIQQVNGMEQQANLAIEQSLSGGNITQVEVFSAVKKADLALKMMMQVRNKLLEAFNEIKQLRM